MKSTLLIVVASGLIAGCSLFGGDDGPAEIPIEELRAAPTSLEVDGKTVALRTYMWRDFMPISPADGNPLIAIFWIYVPDESPLPDGLSADAAWVLNGDSVWDTFFEDEERPDLKPNELERIARDGPLWDPYIAVDAVVRVVAADGSTHLLRAPDQRIERTE
jgi:hypothetical protein